MVAQWYRIHLPMQETWLLYLVWQDSTCLGATKSRLLSLCSGTRAPQLEKPSPGEALALRLENQFSSVAQSCPTLCDPMNYSTSGFPVHHQLPESTHTHVHWVGDAIQPSYPLSFPSPPALNLSQHQGLFQWVSSSLESSPPPPSQLEKARVQHRRPSTAIIKPVNPKGNQS